MWDKERIHKLLDKSDEAVRKAIVAIYLRQTPDEIAGQQTRHTNSVGFSKFDAEFLTSLANQIRWGKTLSPAQMAIGRNKIKRYHRQLVEIANEKEAQRAPRVVTPSIQPAVDPVMQAEIDAERASINAEQERDMQQEYDRMAAKFKWEQQAVGGFA